MTLLQILEYWADKTSREKERAYVSFAPSTNLPKTSHVNWLYEIGLFFAFLTRVHHTYIYVCVCLYTSVYIYELESLLYFRERPQAPASWRIMAARSGRGRSLVSRARRKRRAHVFGYGSGRLLRGERAEQQHAQRLKGIRFRIEEQVQHHRSTRVYRNARLSGCEYTCSTAHLVFDKCALVHIYDDVVKPCKCAHQFQAI